MNFDLPQTPLDFASSCGFYGVLLTRVNLVNLCVVFRHVSRWVDKIYGTQWASLLQIHLLNDYGKDILNDYSLVKKVPLFSRD